MGSEFSCPSFPFKWMSPGLQRRKPIPHSGADPSCPKVSTDSKGLLCHPSPTCAPHGWGLIPPREFVSQLCQRDNSCFLEIASLHIPKPMASPAHSRCSLNVPSFMLSSLLLGAALQPAQPLKSQVLLSPSSARKASTTSIHCAFHVFISVKDQFVQMKSYKGF